MRREWLVSLLVTLVTVVLVLGTVRLFAPQLLGGPKDLGLVKLDRSLPSFYGTVFGATPAATMGAIQIVTFPDGGPGLVLLPSDSESPDHGAFIIQVPDLGAAKTLALANGATEQGTFEGKPGGQDAQSVDLLDPWGNQIEILQLG